MKFHLLSFEKTVIIRNLAFLNQSRGAVFLPSENSKSILKKFFRVMTLEKKIMYMIPGGLLVGFGVGLAYGDPGLGLFIGLGSGFIFIAIHSLILSNIRRNEKDHHTTE
ncbi:hypothetical protein H1D32_08595 [Anaerobacillus sp. CMMVII]|uniref:hypothetical protein n=1 Tax=Anaerobacillus sp. CMMVII TaxID=2755588 RepID=UPI0021B78DFB|nr:hypothetical protein [Anaerobacillus sp. CMMVII]MCT8137808.1 hypothetical protein [Anaerobacillus sp. CMMVII]